MAKIKLGSNDGNSTLNAKLILRKDSALEFESGDGHDASVQNISLVELPDNINSLQLATELGELITSVESDGAKHDPKELEALKSAKEAAQTGHRSEIVQQLKKVGSWAIENATKIGVDVASAAIKASLNIK
jgi:uncharacterized protein (DUF885 family)